MKSFIPFVVIGLSVGMYFAYIAPTTTEIKVLRENKVAYDNLILKSAELKKKRDSVLQLYNSIPEENISKLNKIIPETFNPVIFANDLNSMVSGYGLTIKDFKTNETKTEVRDTLINQPKNQFYKTTAVSFRVEGSYDQFLKFMKDVESSLHLMDVVGLSLRPTGNAGKSDNFEFNLDVYTYSLR
ncbi:type 4a pilus biogenesis protein PilO [Patescibacteria group bacterium]|nr:type 4a pilus biogenesis protein PilO [Patescibacteria group bacterium]